MIGIRFTAALAVAFGFCLVAAVPACAQHRRSSRVDRLVTPKSAGSSFMDQPRYDQFHAQRPGRERVMLPMATLGYSDELSSPSRSPLTLALSSPEDFRALSGLNAATSLDLPLPGAQYRLPDLTAYRYTPQAPTTRFKQYFGLESTAPPNTPKVAFASFSEALQWQVDARIRRIQAEALALFKQGTIEARDRTTDRYPTCTDCEEKLDRAQRQLRIARDLDLNVYLPSVLLMHMALDQDRPSLALIYLAEAYRRNPDMFEGGSRELDPYFGDAPEGQRSPMLMDQMRRYARIGDLNSKDPAAQVLQAYCCWRAEDMEAARRAAATVVTLMRDIGGEESIAVSAMAASLERATTK